ncbi:hypothetical protein [Devosia alba]|uniref:hypothetical protein n=1 Tax=Devosia alba TaxID=3152360 RepID=UPI00326506DA
MSVLLGVIAVFALLSLVVAAMQAIKIVRQAPASEDLGSFMVLGWWKFATLEAKAGPAAAAQIAIYKRATIAFLIFIVLGVLLSGWAVNQGSGAQAAAAPRLINDPRVLPAEFAFNTDLRRVAMPGVPLSES